MDLNIDNHSGATQQNTEIFKNDPELQQPLQSIENPIAPQKLQVLQQQDTSIEILK